jgi:hypothetical protein
MYPFVVHFAKETPDFYQINPRSLGWFKNPNFDLFLKNKFQLFTVLWLPSLGPNFYVLAPF